MFKAIKTIAKELSEITLILNAIRENSSDLFKKVEELDKFATGSLRAGGTLEIAYEDKVGVWDFRGTQFINKDLMVKCLIIKKDGETSLQYTHPKNLTKQEQDYYKENNFVIVEDIKNEEITS